MGTEFETELCGDHYAIADGSQGFADQFLVPGTGPYASAVSKKVTPRSTAARIKEIICCRSGGWAIGGGHSHAT